MAETKLDREDVLETLAERKFSRLAVLDKVAMTIIATILSFVIAQLWHINKEFGDVALNLELKFAGLQGEQKQILNALSNLVDNGSHSAQRTEVMVQALTDRMNRFEDFMSKGRRFTADDGDKLEKKVDKNFENLDERVRKVEERSKK